MRFNREFVDKFIAVAVLIQPCLIVIQHLIISIFGVDLETSTSYRVLLTAIPLSCAIILSFRRKPQLYLMVYTVVIFILCTQIIIFPRNIGYLFSESTRFLLPVVIPSALCLMTISRIEIVEDMLYKLSWFTSFFALIYMLSYLRGIIVFERYNMSFSYALLLPMLSLYSKKNLPSIITSIFLFITVLAIGSRGAALFFVGYVVFDAIQYNKNYLIPLVITGFISILLIPVFIQFLEGIGIHSRTLSLLVNDSLAYSSGRDAIYSDMMNVFMENYMLGIGLFGDRYYLNGSYTHNIIVEILLNFGLFLGTAILFYVFWVCIKVYTKLDKRDRNVLVKYILGTIAPFMFSQSYLKSENFGIFIGILYILYKRTRVRTTIS